MSIIDPWPRSFCLMSIHEWPWRGLGAAPPVHSLPTYSSMAESVHNWQFVHSATSMIMFHFFMTLRFLYHFAGTKCASCSVRLISLSFSIAAKVSDMCSMRPSHTSTCTIDCAPASECVVLVWVLCGVSRLRQPPRSTDLPGSPIGA